MEYWASFAVMSLSVMISMYFIQGMRPDFKDFKTYIYYFICLILFILNYEFIPALFRLISNTFIYITMSKLLFKENFKKSCLLGLYIVFLNIISEIIYAILFYNIIKYEIFIENNALKVFMDNIIISLILVFVSYILGKQNRFNKIISNLKKIKSRQIIAFSFFLVVIFNFFMWFVYFVFDGLYDNTSLIFIGYIISVLSAVLLFNYLKTNNKYADIAEKYNISLDSIKNYEQIIDNNRINNHETRNQFLMIRSMSKNKRIISYIDSILNNNLSDREELLDEVMIIPSGGLRGLIYTKLLLMKENNINYELHVDKKVNVSRINKIESNCMVDICKIIGVFLDNAIEAVQELDEKNITIELYVENKNLIISITNNFAGYIDAENLDKAGYTTKSSGHGYGLRLVKDIIFKNERLENDREIYEDNFTQNLKIKM